MNNLIQNYEIILKELTKTCSHISSYKQIRIPKLSDLELIALNICAEYMSINTEMQLFKDLCHTNLEGKIERSVYNKRKRKLFGYMEKIRETLSNKFAQFTRDKGYQSLKNEKLTVKKELKSRILKKVKKNKALKESEKRFNKLCGRIRYQVERTFGSIKRCFLGGTARYKDLLKMHTQNLLEGMAYNLYRSPGIIASKVLKMAK